MVDLGAIDVERGRDHGMPSYNQLREAYGLQPRSSFTQITGESSDAFPAGTGVDSPASLEFTSLTDTYNAEVDRDDEDALEATPTRFSRGAPLAARLRAIYGNQMAALNSIRDTYGIDFWRNLGDVIASNSDIPRADLPFDVFFDGGNVPPASCRVTYRVDTQWNSTPTSGGFGVTMSITNTGSTPIPAGWTLRFLFPDGHQIVDNWNGVVAQVGPRVPITNQTWNGPTNPGQTVDGVGFTGIWSGTNGRPTAFSVNTTQCSVG